jgi:hypothetical protein
MTYWVFDNFCLFDDIPTDSFDKRKDLVSIPIFLSELIIFWFKYCNKLGESFIYLLQIHVLKVGFFQVKDNFLNYLY